MARRPKPRRPRTKGQYRVNEAINAALAARTGDGYARQCVTVDGRPKLKYLTRDAARAARRRHPAKADLDIYRCPQCGCLHLGTDPRRRQEPTT